MMPSAAIDPTFHPFIGLRYFEEADAALFYGRDEQTIELLGKLARNRFVAVLGSSGSGKSSLVRAGLLPELRSGMIPHAGPRWTKVEFKPGNAPMAELAEALTAALGVKNSAAMLDEGPMGIANVVAAAALPPNTNVLIIADQFEEVFRFQREERDKGCLNEAEQQCQELVRRLLSATGRTDVSVYVLLVMRSDHLGECAQFVDLPEKMSTSMYLVPRLRRDEIQESITAPVGNNIEPALVQELIGRTGSDPDQLPRLQHLLSRMWTLAGGERLGLKHYEKAGRWDGALDQHLSDIYKALDKVKPCEVPCARLFQQLSELDESNRAVRRRATLDDLIAICGPDVERVAAAYRAEGFLRSGKLLDLTHECILRNWDQLKGWLKYEKTARDFYREINVRRARGTHLTGQDIRTAESYFSSGHFSPRWAVRYGSAKDYAEIRQYVTASAKAELRAKRKDRRLVQASGALGTVIFLFSIGAAYWFWRETGEIAHDRDAINKDKQALEKSVNELVGRRQEFDEAQRQAVEGRKATPNAVIAKSNLAMAMPEANRSDFTVQYFVRSVEQGGNGPLAKAWKDLGFTVQVMASKFDVAPNRIWYGSQVDRKAVQLIAYSMLANGIPLREVVPLPDYMAKGREKFIQVGWSSFADNKPLMTSQAIQILRFDKADLGPTSSAGNPVPKRSVSAQPKPHK